jgi:hypothetical protein
MPIPEDLHTYFSIPETRSPSVHKPPPVLSRSITELLAPIEQETLRRIEELELLGGSRLTQEDIEIAKSVFDLSTPEGRYGMALHQLIIAKLDRIERQGQHNLPDNP